MNPESLFGLCAKHEQNSNELGNVSLHVRLQLVAADANGEKVVHSSPASDMWALGVLAYEMFAGYVASFA